MSHTHNLEVQSNSSCDNKNLLSDNYIIIKEIGSGSFGEVYLAQHKNGGYVAAKVEDCTKSPRVLNEYKIYKYLQKHGFKRGIPKIYGFIQTPDYNIMFMQLLGPSLEDLFNSCNRKFEMSTVLFIAEQLIDLLEQLHNANFIHRDIKPNNFLIGREHKDHLYMMDFGLSKKYVEDGEHMNFRDNRSLIGTARYASMNMHMGFEPSRRDDLESVGYMLIYFLKGKLPWQGLKKKKGVSNLELIGDVKICTSLDKLCEDEPECFKDYIRYCRKLKFDEKPDYKYLRGLFQNTCLELDVDARCEWA